MKKYRSIYSLALLLSIGILGGIIFLQVPAFTFEQPSISIRVENERLKDVLDKIELLSGYEITLKPRWHDVRVSVKLSNVPLDRALILILGVDINYAVSWKEAEKKINIYMREIPPKIKEVVVEAEPEQIIEKESVTTEKAKGQEAQTVDAMEKDEIQQKKKKKWVFKVGRSKKNDNPTE